MVEGMTPARSLFEVRRVRPGCVLNWKYCEGVEKAKGHIISNDPTSLNKYYVD